MPTSSYHTVILPVRRNRQDTDYNCGPASLAIVFSMLGIAATEDELARLAGTSAAYGTHPEALASVLEVFDVAHEVVSPASIEEIERRIRALSLCIVEYQQSAGADGTLATPDDGHYAVVFGFSGTHFYLADPFDGKGERRRAGWGFTRMRKDRFLQRWNDVLLQQPVDRWLLAVPMLQPETGMILPGNLENYEQKA